MGGLEIKKERKACPIVSRKHCVNNSFNFIHKHLCKILFYAYIQPYIHIHPIHILCTIYIILVNLKMFLVKILPLGSGSGSALKNMRIQRIRIRILSTGVEVWIYPSMDVLSLYEGYVRHAGAHLEFKHF